MSSLLSIVATPAQAIGTLYDPATGNGDVACTTDGAATGFVTISSRVLTIGTNCTGELAIPEGVESIGFAALWGSASPARSSLSRLTLPSSLKTIDNMALQSNNLATLTIPASVESIGVSAFANNALTSVNFLGSSSTPSLSIDSDAFLYQRNGFRSITFPTRLLSLASNSLTLGPVPNLDFLGMQSVDFLGTIPTGWSWSASPNVQVSGKSNCGTSGYFTISNNVVIDNALCKGSVTIPEGVIAIGNNAFDHMVDVSVRPNVTSLSISSTVTSIGAFAFRTSKLAGPLVIPNNVTSMGIQAFIGSTEITSLVIGSGITSIPDNAFDNFPSLNSLTLPSGLTSIGRYAFWFTQALTSLTIPDSVHTIGENAFGDPPGSRTLNYCGIADLEGTGLPNPSSNASSCVLGAPSNLIATPLVGSASIAFTAGTGRSSITNYQYSLDGTTYTALSPADSSSPVIIPGLTNGSSYTLRLKAVNAGGVSVASTSVSFATEALYDGSSGIVACGTSGFFTISSNALVSGSNCVGSVNIPSGVTSIGDGAFSQENGSGAANQITSLTIPNSVTYFGWAAFARTDSMTSLSLGNGLTGFGQYSFSNITSLTSLVIPANVTSISEGNFSFAQNLTSLTFPSGITSIHSNTFSQIQPGTPFTYCGTTQITFSGNVVLTPTCPSEAPRGFVSTQPIGAASGSALGTQPVIHLRDSSSNILTGSTASVRASIASGSGTLTGTTTVAAVAGIATFTNLVITGTPGPFTLTFTPVGVSIPVTSNSLTISDRAALTPTFGTPTATANGFTFQISNYDGEYTWGGSATASGSVSISDTGLVTVTGVAPATSSTATITTSRTGYLSGSATVNGTSASNIATLSALTLSSGTLSQTFSSSTTSYTATVSNATTSITVTPTKSQANATITVNGTTVASTFASGNISLNVGANIITVIGTAQNGIATATYTVTVTRAAPAPTITYLVDTFTPGVSQSVRTSLSNFDETQRYQVTVKFVNPATSVEAPNGTLTATQGSTTLITGYTSYSGEKLGFKGTYAAISAALSSLTWNPAIASGSVSMRIGIASEPGNNEFYDANSARYYKYVSNPLTWVDARTAAEATTLFGLRGYLVEVNSAAENSFIGNETSAANVWIGATDRAVEGTWIWDGATATYAKPTGSGSSLFGRGIFSSWAGREPNNHKWYSATDGEDCVVTNWQGAKGFWNDWPCPIPQPYLIEFGGRPGETSTAVSTTLTTTVRVVNPPPFIATYDKNGALGSLAKASDTYVQGGTQISLPGVGTMSKTGYAFAGWSTSGSTPVISGTYAPTSNVTLKAVWTPIQYTVTYNPNGGNAPPAQSSLTMGQTFNLADPITKPPSGGISYQFAFWNNGSSNIKAGTTITVGSANLTYSAVWVEEYEVTYGANGGTFAGSDTNKDDQCLGAGNKCSVNQVITLNEDPTRVGHTFAGWENQGGNPVTDSTPGTPGVQTTVTSSNFIFSAKWTAIPYTITYVSSGSVAPTQTSKNIGQIFKVGGDVTKGNFRFNGWSDGNATYWLDSDYLVGSTNITLTAQWIPLYSVTYSEGTGTGTPPSDSATYETADRFDVLGEIGLEKPDFRFTGWSDGTSTYQTGATYIVNSNNVTLTAQWEAIFTVAYAQTLGPSGGTPPTDATIYRAGDTFVVASGSGLTNSGFTFSGWSDGTVTYQSGSRYTVGSSNVVLTAQWSANPVANVQSPAPIATVVDDPAKAQTKLLLEKKANLEVLQRAVTQDQKTYSEFFAPIKGTSATLLPSNNSDISINGKVETIKSSQSAKVELFVSSVSLSDQTVEQLKNRALVSVSGTELTVKPVGGFTGVLVVPVIVVNDGVESLAISKVVVNPAAPKPQNFAPKAINQSSISWEPSTSQVVNYLVKVNGEKACQTIENSCPISKLIGPKSTVTLTAIGNDETASEPVVIPYRATAPIPALKVSFTPGSAVLSNAQKVEIQSVARIIRKEGFTKLVVNGFTAALGTESYTKNLSDLRASAVADYLKSLLPKIKIKSAGFGATNPVASNASKAGQQKNRRTEISTW